MKRAIGAFLYFVLLFILASCLEVKERININRDGSGDARIEFAVQDEWAGQVVPGLKKDIPKGWRIIGERKMEGKHVVIFGRAFKNISELNDEESSYSFSSGRKSVFHKSYYVEVRQRRSSSMLFPYEMRIRLPGRVEDTNGIKVSYHEIKWNLQGFREGTRLYARSTGISMPAFLENRGRVIFLLAVVLIGVVVFLALKIAPHKEKPVPGIYCTQCGRENPVSAAFCTNCGERLQ
ncbi:MAG: zinc ribbon domain-containing protein [Desulfobacteraceae bacterium]|nr:zinc ribbon domain-containing protein [Nitrospiraceae bacterium]MDA8162902.1 zinc ribbon domain-containing protein [Desulfobacteraceae bacterium]